MLNFDVRIRLLWIIFTFMLMSGCSSRGNIGNELDEAALFGREVSSFVMPDGSEASLREFKGQYSVKFHRFSRVVVIDKAVTVRFKSTAHVDGYSLLILDKSMPGCQKMTQLLAVREREIRVWELGNCRDDPQVSITKEQAVFDVPDGRQQLRYQFNDGKLRYASVDYPPRGVALPEPLLRTNESVSTSPQGNEHVSSKPVRASTETKTGRSEQPILPSGKLIFQSKEQAPKTIYMDK